MPPAKISDEELRLDVDAYMASGGNRSEAARQRGLHRHTYRDRLKMAETRLKVSLGKVADGRMDTIEAEVRPLPRKGKVARYILSACQNNTHPHKAGFRNILAYRDWLHAGGDTCELILGSFSYAIDAYGAKSVKRDRHAAQGDLWYSPELVPFIADRAIQLAPALVWCGEMNILPTASNPLVGLDDYNGRASNIVPHVKHAMESVASLPDEATKFNYSTGAITLRNYIQKRAGIVAERRHNYGAVLVEVDSAGNWYVRQLVVGDRGEIYDVGPKGCAGVRVADGAVSVTCTSPNAPSPFLEAITWGDIHAAEMDLAVRELGWGEGGMLDTLRPRYQFLHDVFSMRSRSHHEMKNFHRTFAKFVNGEDIVQDEMDLTRDFLHEAARPWCESVIVRSNHDRHLDRWLNEADPSRDPANARYFTELQLAMLGAIEGGDRDFNVLQYALTSAPEGLPETVRFLGEDESFVICKNAAGGVECGLHGDLGPNGSRGSTRSLSKLGRPANKAHDHKATIAGQVYSAGACSLSFPYMRGPSAHSVSHILTFCNGARQIITFWGNKWRA